MRTNVDKLDVKKRLLNWVMVFFAAAISVLGLSQTALAQESRNTLQSVNATAMQGGRVVIRLNFKDALPGVPNGFAVTNPSRVVLDLNGVANGLGKSLVEVGQGDVKSINVVEAGSRTRVVLNLARTLPYAATIDDKALVLTFEAQPASGSNEAAQVTKFAEPTPTLGAAQKFSIRGVDFRRGNNGEGRVIVDLSSASAGVDIRRQGKVVIVDFVGATVPASLIRRLDVLDFATPVRTVDTVQQGANARMIIEPKGLWEYSAYQTDLQFIIEIKPIKEDPNKLVQGTEYSGDKLTLNFQNIEVRAVLQVIADFTGLNIITSDTVAGSLTLRLKDVPWDQALDIILQSKGLAKRKNGNVVLIAPSQELAQKEKEQLEANQQVTDLEAVRTETFVLAYAKASEVQTLLSGDKQKLLTKRGSVSVDSRTNTLFVQDVPSRLDEVRRLLSQLDVPVRQVSIEARIVIADDLYGRQLGARFGFGASTVLDNRNLGVGPSIAASGSLANAKTPTGGDLNVNLPVAGAAGTLAMTFLNLGNSNIVNLELSALESDNRGKVVSNPRIIAADKKKAIITQGTELPYLTQASSGGATVAFKPAILSLEVTPQITPDDRIIMDLDIKKDSIGQLVQSGTGSVPSIDTKTLKTQILVSNGDTAVLGGIFEQTTRTDVTKVPFLGDLPFIGNMFKTTRKQDNKTELLIFITPRIIKEELSIR